MPKTLNERRADASATLGLSVRALPRVPSTRVPDEFPLGTKWGTTSERAALRSASEDARSAHRELQRLERRFDNDPGADPNRYILEIRASELRLKTAMSALSKLGG